MQTPSPQRPSLRPPISLPNWFEALDGTYAQAAKKTNKPARIKNPSNSPSLSQSPNRVPIGQYKIKSAHKLIMVMENTYLNSKMEPDLSKNFLPDQNYFSIDRLKQRTFYESILIFTNSYEIELFSKLGKEPPNYSKCTIFKFDSEQD